MSQMVTNGAMLTCSFAMPPVPVPLTVLPANRVMVENQPAATIMDHAPMVNIPSFGMCMAPTNPQVIANTAAAMGVPTPAPCLPVTPAPWLPGSPTVTVGQFPALNLESKCLCNWLGVITVAVPMAFRSMVP